LLWDSICFWLWVMIILLKSYLDRILILEKKMWVSDYECRHLTSPRDKLAKANLNEPSSFKARS
jgi:hypothetical protein